PGSVGYVHLLAGLPVLGGALAAVSLGARLNQSLDTGRLRLIFGILFILLGARLAIQNATALPGLL
ncbi:MAG: hypothetical protein GWM90_10770, partial [Gemmatimonadetes bacterium]|nr:hypothetical protein [Gemmatimonadota bacterium]NIQ54437.1 hypothetical protein [Gemmatimonadota bacterium]NIU74645.1 hypothetical protein [Gammaproteobacteria bacterium]NIX38457.1 hypothetical protein [Gemmatimonadota bacterium]NIX44576.1 hypothetical protein [Gemmatimonadota bacterium]